MSRLRDIKELINGVAPQWSSVSTKLKGLPIYVDPLLTGTSRFSRKTGSTVGLINPEVQVFLAKGVNTNDTTLTLDRTTQWLANNCVLHVAGVEKFRITDINSTIISLNTKVKIKQTAGKVVNLYSVPIESINDYAKGTMVLQIRSTYKMMVGDVVAFEVYKNVFNEIEIIDLVDVGITNNAMPYTYEITLATKTPIALSQGGRFDLRAYPAYFSKVLKIPNNPVTNKEIGPFLLDYFQGRILTGLSPKTFLSITSYDLFNNLLHPAISLPNNYPITARSLNSSTFMFWDLMHGSFNVNSGSVAICDSNGLFGITYDCKPLFKKGDSWKISLTSTNEATVKINFEPDTTITLNTVIGLNTFIIRTDQDYSKITITISSVAGSQHEFSNWQLMEAEVARVEYSILSRVVDEATWLSTGLIVKPLFLTLDYLSTNYDLGDSYDSGLLSL